MARQTSELVSPANDGATQTESDLRAYLLPSNRKFGTFFAVVFIIAGAYTWWSVGKVLALTLFIIATAFGALALIRPNSLARLNRAWFLFGHLLGRIVSPVVLGLLFFFVITPVALITRVFGRDELRLRKRTVTSYWRERTPTGPSAESFKKQF